MSADAKRIVSVGETALPLSLGFSVSSLARNETTQPPPMGGGAANVQAT